MLARFKGIALNIRIVLGNIFTPTSKQDNDAIRAVWFDVEAVLYNRYLFNLVKFFEINGYKVYFKPRVLRYLTLTNQYARLLFKEDNVKFSRSIPPNCVMAFSDRDQAKKELKFLSTHYYEHLAGAELIKTEHYQVPMAMHPYMYIQQYWDKQFHATRKHSIFFAGNFDEKVYSQFSEENKFPMLDRTAIYNRLKTLAVTVFPKSYQELVTSKKEGQVVVVCRDNFAVPMESLRETIAAFAFFLACPGMVMPFSHNVIEAMSVGTIPIIHQNYATLFIPALQHKHNAIVFDDTDFEKKIEEALHVSETDIDEMIKNVQQYYGHYLSPEAVVNNILTSTGHNIYLLDGINSVNLI